MFKFNLQSVLSLREKMEDSKKREFGFAVQEEEKRKAEKNQLEAEKQVALNETREQTKDKVNILYIKAFNHYNSIMNKKIDEKEKEIEKAHIKTEEKRQELLEAMKDRKILENLRERHLEAFIEEEKHEEQRLTDDIVTYRFRNQQQA